MPHWPDSAPQCRRSSNCATGCRRKTVPPCRRNSIKCSRCWRRSPPCRPHRCRLGSKCVHDCKKSLEVIRHTADPDRSVVYDYYEIHKGPAGAFLTVRGRDLNAEEMQRVVEEWYDAVSEELKAEEGSA